MSDLKIPTRPAPAPPKVDWLKQNGPTSKRTVYDRDPFLDPFKLSRSQSAGKLGETKKPPPRPPPPKQKQSSHLLSNIFMRNKPSGGGIPKSQTCGELKRQVTSGGGSLLIDLSSPPSSPTLTAHSGSDNFSVNSFGSDGLFTSSNQVESGFEDDFDLFMLPNTTTPSVSDLWADDPFSNTKQSNQPFAPFELSNEDPRCKHKAITQSVSTSAKPTIIRPKNSKPARPPPPKLRPSSTPPTFVSLPPEETAGLCLGEWSPPMPNSPPPPPPPEVLETLEHGPSIPPRPSTLIKESLEKKKPYCIALYDYEASHPDDLSFKVNDVIYLKERVNDDWLRGSLKGREGMFPTNYVKVVVPLDDDTQDTNYVLALYTFRPESWDDLPFQEGESIRVKKRINEHWLFGECNGRQGLFPVSYVTDVSSLLHP